MVNNSTSWEQLSAAEADPVLQIASRLHQVTIVADSPYQSISFPHICWIDAKEFFPLTDALMRYPGSFRWSSFTTLPRRCMVVEPNPMKGESPFIGRGPADTRTLQEAQELADHLERFRIPAPWRNSPVVELSEFRSRVLLEMDKAAAFLEKDLALTNKPSMGISISKDSLELPLIEDHAGPGYGVVLVADPEKYARERSATSVNDRAIHYWITEDEAALLGSVVSGLEDQNNISSDGGREQNWPLLERIAAMEYQSQIIKSSEIIALEREVNRLSNQITSKDLSAPLERILSVCRSARSYRLGIYIPANQ